LITDLISSWNNLLNWSENAAVARRLQEEIVVQKQLLDTIANDIAAESFDSEAAIREKIQELNVRICRFPFNFVACRFATSKFGMLIV